MHTDKYLYLGVRNKLFISKNILPTDLTYLDAVDMQQLTLTFKKQKSATDCLRAICMMAMSSKWLSSGDHLYMEHTEAPKWSPPAIYSSLSPENGKECT